MRLAILDRAHGLATKALFAVIRAASGHSALDVIKLVRYRPDFYGTPMQRIAHEAMRGPSAWSVGDRELMAAFIAQTNACEWCVRAHSATAEGADGGPARVSSVLADLESAAIDEPLRATLRMLRKLAREHAVDAADLRALLDAGVAPDRIEDALAVSFAFNVMGRLADAFGFADPGDAAYRAGAKYLLARGYR